MIMMRSHFLTIFTREAYLLDPSDRAFVMLKRKSKSGTMLMGENDTFPYNYA